MRKQKGITIIALVITIVVLLILAGVTINLVLGNNGIIIKAQEATEEYMIAKEKEIIGFAQNEAKLDKDNPGSFNISIFEESVKKQAGEENVKIDSSDNIIEVLFKNTKRYYDLDKEGNIEGPEIFVVEEYAGDITKGGKLNGSVENPYEINCIEDLVAFSIMSNGRR